MQQRIMRNSQRCAKFLSDGYHQEASGIGVLPQSAEQNSPSLTEEERKNIKAAELNRQKRMKKATDQKEAL
jgi:hypothetical protein